MSGRSDLERRKRINRIKKTIMGMIAAAILIPCIICIILGVKLRLARNSLEETRAELDQIRDELAGLKEAAQTNQPDENVIRGGDSDLTDAEDIPEGTIVAKDGSLVAENGVSLFAQETLLGQEEYSDTSQPYYIYLTFDDGPSSLTDEILGILREYDVKATFFVTGKKDEDDTALYSRIVEGGHTLGMHSFSHKYDEIYASTDAFSDDLEKIRSLIKETAGVSPIYYRFPGGSSNNVAPLSRMESFIDILHEEGIEYIDWNIEAGDASSRKLTADEIVDNVFKDFGKYHTNVVLLHDGSGHKATVEALPAIIERARNMGAQLVPITEATVPIQHR